MEEDELRTNHIRHGIVVFARVVGSVLVTLAAFVVFVLFADYTTPPPAVPAPQQTSTPYAEPVTSVPVGARTPTPTARPPLWQSEDWILNQNESTVYTIRWAPLYSCPRTDCDQLVRLPPGDSWQLPFTLKSDGWLYTHIYDPDLIGYVRAADLSEQIPARCSMPLSYRVDHIGSRFTELGYTRERIKDMALEAERDIEGAIGRNVLEYVDDAPNTINLVISYYRESEPYHRGLHVTKSGFPNGVVGQFWIGIYAALIDDVDQLIAERPEYAKDRILFIDNLLYHVILHEMVHTTGFVHLDDPDALMCGDPNCKPAPRAWDIAPTLTAADDAALRDWCGTP